jgi:hypothetical protein
MPTYTMKDPSGEPHEFICTIAEMEEKKEQGWTHILSTGTIIRGLSTSGQGGGNKTSGEWKDTLRKIRDAHPGSTIDV